MDGIRYRNIIDAVYGAPWCIEPTKFDAMVDFLRAKAMGLQIHFTAEQFEAAAERGRKLPRTNGKIATLPLFGVLAKRMNMMTDFSGGTSTEQFGQAFDAAMANKDVGAVVIQCDSPGGSVSGVPELAAKIFSARGTKPIYAVADGMMCSAAYWVCSQADSIIATPSALVGSIGALYEHTDKSAMNEKMGLKTTRITAGKYKAEGNSDEPLDDEARAQIQGMVDAVYDDFTSAVAQGRDTTQFRVKKDYGEGRVFLASKAKELGIVDRIATFDQITGELAGKVNSAGPRAEGEIPEVTAETPIDMDLERRRWRQIKRGA